MASRKPTESTAARLGPAEQIDRELARRALEKIRQGKTPTAQERAALKRVEKQREEELRWMHYATIPQKHWIEMSGRQAKIINEQAARYGIPFAGATIDLRAVVRSLHDFLARYKPKAESGDAPAMAPSEEELLDGSDSPMLEKLREERWLIARMDRMAKERQLIPREEARQGFAQVAAVLRRAGEMLQKQFGPDALELVEEALQDAERSVQELFNAAQ